MIPISTHLHLKAYQVATTTNPDLPYRKWDHLGTVYAVTHRSAALNIYKGEGEIVDERTTRDSVVFVFSCGMFISVKL